jgi:L-lysine exporter family protein LysE/ArgO
MNSANLPLIEGFFLSAGLIVGIGPRNTLILRQGLCRQHLRLIVMMCTLVDAILIGLGTVGVGALIQNEWLIKLMTYSGVAALLFYGACSFRAAFSPALAAKEAMTLPTRRQIVTALLTVNFLNPNLYIDTVLLIGGGSSHYQPNQRLWFAVGAIAASLVWFLGLSYGSALLAPVLKQARVLRAVDLFSGSLLWFMAFRLASHLS